MSKIQWKILLLLPLFLLGIQLETHADLGTNRPPVPPVPASAKSTNTVNADYAYHPDGTPYLKNGSNQFGTNVFQYDAQGITLYHCPPIGQDNGTGFIVVSDQVGAQTEFEFFDRQSWDYLGTLLINGVSNTDGVASTQQALPGYPMGIFAAINNDTSTVGVGWDKVLAAMGLACDNSSAVSPTLSIEPAVDDGVNLNWTAHAANNCSHEPYRDNTPYFAVNDATADLLATTIHTSYYAPSTLGDVSRNYYFMVRALNCDASSSALSNRVGEFDFKLR